MIQKEGIIINGIYQHYKGDYYLVVDVAYHHEDAEKLAVVIYQKCDENGIFKSIRKPNSIEDTVGQPFWRLVNEFKHKIKIHDPIANNPTKFNVIYKERFNFIKVANATN
jgi:hypothetical protein